MMDFYKACEIATKHFKGKGRIGIRKALEATDFWIFYGGLAEPIEIGGNGISVQKADGGIKDFILPSMENFKIKKSAVAVEIPSEFLANYLK